MAILVTNDLTLDEDAGVDSGTGDDDIAALSFNLVDDALETYLLGLAGGATTGFPQYAKQTNYLQSSSTIDDYALVADGSGTAYSTTVGIDSGLTDVDGNSIFLFAYSGSNNVVLGRIGDDPDGDVAFAIVLDEHMLDGHVDSVDSWMIQYTALAHGDPTKVDAGDTLDLSDLVYVESTTTSVTSIFTTSNTLERHGYDLPGYEGGSKEVMDSQLAPANAGFEFWVQFTGDHATAGNNGVPLKAGLPAVQPTSGDGAFANGEIFFANTTSIQVTNDTNGVAGDTIQNGEVMDMLFYDGDPDNPTDVIDQPPDQYANGIFLRFDGIGNREDLVVVLKLATKSDVLDGGALTITTKAVVIDAADILKNSALASQFPDYLADYLVAKPLDNNDGLVVIEANDYNFGTDNYVIVGAQLLSSTEKVTGSGINLKTETGSTGGSAGNGTELFGKSTTQDTDVIKISDIGFIREGASETVHEYLEIGGNLVIQDDGPSIVAVSGSVDLTISEILDFGAARQADFSGLFATPDYGVDGAAVTGALTYDIGTPDVPSDSGMIDTATGQHIFLFLEDNDETPLIDFDHKVVGRHGTTAGAIDQTDDSNINFFLYVDQAGEVILQQDRAVQHDTINGDPADDSVTFSSDNFVTLTATVTDKDGDTNSATIPIGTSFSITDAAPVIDQTTIENLTPVSNNPAAAPSSGDVDGAAGNDGGATYAWTITGAPSGSGGLTVEYTDATHQSILGKLGTTDLYTLTVDNNGGYTFDLLSALPGSSEDVSSTQIHAGGPTTQVDLQLETSTDYVRITGTTGGVTANVNASNGYAGIDNGNLDAGEKMSISLWESNDTAIQADDYKRDITGITIPTKTGNYTTHYNYTAYNDDVLVYSGSADVVRNGSISVNTGSILFDTLVIEDTNANAVKVGIGDSTIFTMPPDIQLNFELRLTDGDGDFDTTSFFVEIDGNGGGISNPTPYAFDLIL